MDVVVVGAGEVGYHIAEILSHEDHRVSVIESDAAQARRLVEQKDSMRDRERAAAEQHLERLKSGRPESIETSSLHLDILRDLKRIHSHLTSVAYPILEQTGELKRSRLATG